MGSPPSQWEGGSEGRRGNVSDAAKEAPREQHTWCRGHAKAR